MNLQEAVSFDEPTPSSDGQGGSEEGWTPSHTCRANFLYLRGGEIVLQGRLAGRQPVVVTIRNCSAARLIEPDWRMRDTRRDLVYNVRSIVPSTDRLYLELTCERGVSVRWVHRPMNCKKRSTIFCWQMSKYPD